MVYFYANLLWKYRVIICLSFWWHWECKNEACGKGSHLSVVEHKSWVPLWTELSESVFIKLDDKSQTCTVKGHEYTSRDSVLTIIVTPCHVFLQSSNAYSTTFQSVSWERTPPPLCGWKVWYLISIIRLEIRQIKLLIRFLVFNEVTTKINKEKYFTMYQMTLSTL